MKGIQLFDNYEEDGQLSLFGVDFEDLDDMVSEEASEQAGKGKGKTKQAPDSVQATGSNGPDVRIKRCTSCGKLLFVKEETAGFRAECNNCGIKYFQKL